MRAAGLLPLLLLLGVSSQDDTDPGQAPTTTTTDIPTTTKSANAGETSPTPSAPPPATLQATTTTAQPTVVATTPAQSIIITTKPGTSPSPSTPSPTTVAGANPTTLGSTLPATTTPSHISGQDSSSHSTTNSKTTAAASSATLQQPGTTASSGSSGTTTAAKSILTDAASPPGAVGAVGTSSPTTVSQGKQPLDQLHNTTVSTTVPRTDPSQSSKECVVPDPHCPTKQPPSSSSSPAQGPIPSTSSGSTKTFVTPPTGSSSLPSTPTPKPGSKDTIPEAATRTAPGADQSTQDAGSASAKPTSASQSPASAQPPAPGDQTDQAEGCTSGHPQPNISSSNELICKEQVQHTRPTIHLKEPRTCDEWTTASKNNSFFESFCSTAQHVFDATRDNCKVMLTACKSPSSHWAVRVVLHLPLDSEEVLGKLKEKKDRLEELGIVNITSDKMVEDMTINDEFSTPLIITIITLAGSLLLVAAIYGCHQRFSQKKDQNIHPDVPGFDDGHVALIFNRLTEEMQTMENGYHDNPTLEVMETSSEMQEKKVNLNGELGDSWIVPLDTLMKEDLEEEEDTHL
ncbi:podocalyxin isoform X2 [Onychostruthus taczanowskii]|uniref:podocalyxin isoform X2 n=1 Tax=Onychostruthus taczanowskii TaxID=356909 RepID=UPI001B80A02E|nr:podocalyxin isoform X2 [Onychostruthus taczanowskii]